MGTAAIFAIILLAASGVLLGVVIGVAARIFAVKTDPRIEDVTDMLPGANCGGCGKAGCADFAKAVVACEISPDSCPVCSAETIQNIASFLGVEAGGTERKVAVVLCGGTKSNSVENVRYNGINDCISANSTGGGPKGCRYGCLGMASCARVCPFDAIEIIDGLAYVHNELCVGCGKCVDVCPRKMIKLVPISAPVHVFCNSPEKGPLKKKVCSVACIGCRKCVKAAEEGRMEMEGFCAKVNYADPPSAAIIEEAKCPTGCLKSSGKPQVPEKGEKKKEEKEEAA